MDKFKVFIADDDAMNLRVAEMILKSKYDVCCAQSGEALIELVKSELPALILLDIHMPGMSGFDVISVLKGDSRTKDIPVIFLTADDDRDAEIQGFKVGAMDFIRKPFVAEVVIQRVARIIELNHLQKNLQLEVEKQTRKAEERRQQLESLTVQVMKSLAGAIDAKDKYTNGHSIRVAEYSREIAKRIGKSKKEQEDIYFIGLLHDIGKIGVPDEIINKRTKLTEEEYAIIKTHPCIGSDILKNISELPELEVGARWHHERYDGKGYPDGLEGEQIPEIARIIGVADAYDAMASNRSYRSVLKQDYIRSELVKNKGTQFSPEFADIMIQMIDDDKDFILREK